MFCFSVKFTFFRLCGVLCGAYLILHRQNFKIPILIKMQSNSSNADSTSNFNVISYPQWIGHIHLLTYNNYRECQDEQCDKKYFLDFFQCLGLSLTSCSTPPPHKVFRHFQIIIFQLKWTNMKKELRTPPPLKKKPNQV